MKRIDLLRSPYIFRLTRARWPQLLVRAALLAGLLFSTLAGLMGSPVGGHNFAIIIVWIAWWALLKLVFIPLGGRAWCSVCPIPMPAEWLRRGSLTKTGPATRWKRLRWPRWLRGAWLQGGAFLLVGLFGALTLTTPQVTGWVLLGVTVLALAAGLLFEPRNFCTQLCPIGGFTGLYAQAAPLELRVRNAQVCAAHSEKLCYSACPWGQYPLALKTSANCGLCMECVRACPVDNLALNLRTPGSDLGAQTKHSLDETFMGLVMLASAVLDAAVFLGPWGGLKDAAYRVGSHEWLIYSAGFLGFALILLPGLFTLAVWLQRRLAGGAGTLRQELARWGQTLVPLGLAAWMAFTMSFALTKMGYILPALSDPFGLGWRLLPGVGAPGVGELGAVSAALQLAILAAGLVYASKLSFELAAGKFRAALPVISFCLLIVVGMAALLVA